MNTDSMIHATEAEYEAEYLTEAELALWQEIEAAEEMRQYEAFDEDDEDDEG